MKKGPSGEYFIDRNPDLFAIILEYYRNKTLIVPKATPLEALYKELNHFGIAYQKDDIQTNLTKRKIKEAIREVKDCFDGRRYTNCWRTKYVNSLISPSSFLLLITCISELEPIDTYISIAHAYKTLDKRGNLILSVYFCSIFSIFFNFLFV